MPREQWDRALQPFQRLDDARGEQGHCGLGLAIVNHVIQRHNGTLQFQLKDNNHADAPGRFCTVLVIPRQQTRASDGANVENS